MKVQIKKCVTWKVALFHSQKEKRLETWQIGMETTRVEGIACNTVLKEEKTKKDYKEKERESKKRC